MKFIDSHCHLDLPEFDADRSKVLAECEKAGVAALIVPGVDLALKDFGESVLLTPKVYRAAGLHPWWLKAHIEGGFAIEAISAEIIAAYEQYAIVAVGETGLDRPFAQKQGLSLDLQIASCEQHIAAANQLSLPIIFHCVKAHAELLALLKRCPVSKGGVIHGFAGSIDDARQFVAKGMKIGVGGTITYERACKTREAVVQLKQSDLMLETDAPSMPLAGEQGARNNPINIIKVAQTLAQLRGETLTDVASYTTKNTSDLFGLT